MSVHLERVRRICMALPETTERLSHGEPTFFVRKKVYVMCADNHHNDGRSAVWLPAPPGFQEGLIGSDADTFFLPPYVGHRGWVGVILERISDADLRLHIETAWELIAPTRLRAARAEALRAAAVARDQAEESP
ncbi:MAG: MmcQ/YjbR family DNA-binding protein [Oscillochloris sp.]|nr:MmcQ/YjbR family DNA-binding protein [Oscillochloris sp.]